MILLLQLKTERETNAGWTHVTATSDWTEEKKRWREREKEARESKTNLRANFTKVLGNKRKKTKKSQKRY